MKTAKEMFEELGFYVKYDCESGLYYTSEEERVDLNFDKRTKDLDIFDELEAYFLRPKLIKAIYKQMSELGWLDNEV